MSYYDQGIWLEFERETIKNEDKNSSRRIVDDLNDKFEDSKWSGGKQYKRLISEVVFDRARNKLPVTYDKNYLKAYMLSFDVKKHHITRQILLRTAFNCFTKKSKAYIHGHCHAGSEFLYPEPLFFCGYPRPSAEAKKIHYKELARWIVESLPERLMQHQSEIRFSRRPTFHFISCSAGKESDDTNSFAELFTRELASLGFYCYVIAYDITVTTDLPARGHAFDCRVPKKQYVINDFYPKGRVRKGVVRRGVSAEKSNKRVFYCLSDKPTRVYMEEYRSFFLRSSNYRDNIIYEAQADLRLFMNSAAQGYIEANGDNTSKETGLARAKIFVYRMRKPFVDPLAELLTLLTRKGHYYNDGNASAVRCYKSSFMTYMAKGIHLYAKDLMSHHNRPGYDLRKCHQDIAWLCEAILKIWPRQFEYSKWNRNVSKFRDKLLTKWV
ncbi:MAG: hypothetical protein GY710_20600 [Desulfobacteraceae bacterium]|nr:hypothetical protein [Desulfobacteraceae bacterium]